MRWVRALLPREEAAACDVVLTATTSHVPVLQGRWLKPNALVLAVGASGASVRELDDEAMLSSYIVAEADHVSSGNPAM